MKRLLLFVCACWPVLSSCFDSSAGGGSETEYLTLSGTVLTPGNQPAAGATVRVRPSDYLAEPGSPRLRSQRDTVTSVAGTFRIDGLPAGDYAVEIVLDSVGLLTRTGVYSKAGTSVTGVLARTGTLHASILTPDSGAAYSLQVYGLERKILANASGSFASALPPGDYGARIFSSLSVSRALEFSRIEVDTGGDTTLPAIPASTLRSVAPTSIILDGNIGVATDDAGSLAVLHALADLNEVRILAVGTANASRAAPLTFDAINAYHGRPALRVGTWKGETPVNRNGYDSVVAAEFPHGLSSWDSAPEAASLYAEVLSGEPDTSVVIVAAGPLYNVWALLRRDSALVSRKVKALVVVGGDYPTGMEYNFFAAVARDTFPNVVQEVLRDWRRPIHFHGSGIGTDVFTGACLAGVPATDPVRRAFELQLGQVGRTGSSADMSALLFGVRGLAMNPANPAFWGEVSQGINQVNADGSNTWLASPDANQSYLIRNGTAGALAAELDSLLCRTPGP